MTFRSFVLVVDPNKLPPPNERIFPKLDLFIFAACFYTWLIIFGDVLFCIELNMMTFGKKLITISTLVICIWIVIGILIYRSTVFSSPETRIHFESKTVEDEIVACKSKDQKLSPVFWRKINYLKNEIPEVVKKLVNEVQVDSNFTHYQDSKIHYLYAKPSNKKNLSVLLLHGQSYSADTWNKLQTIQNIAAFGYYAVAIDLPGFGDSPTIQDVKVTEYLSSVIEALNMDNVVIISPSMSGVFSLEFLMKHPEKLTGFIPVSPVNSQVLNQSPCKGPDNYTGLYFDRDCQKVLPFLKSNPPVLNCIKVPTLVVFGEHDKIKSSARLCFLPNAQGAEIPDGKHSAYMSNPELWHKLLYNFLNTLSDTLPCL